MALTTVPVELASLDGAVTVNESSADVDFRVESNGNANMLFVDGGNDAVSIGHGSTIAIAGERHELQVYDTNFSLISAATFRNGSDGANITLGHSRSGTIGTQTVLQDGDTMGGINFVGSDGTDMASYGGRIFCEVDGTPGSNDMPGRLIFATTADNATGSTERMRITSTGGLLVGTTSNQIYDSQSGTGIVLHDTNSYSSCGAHMEIANDADSGWAPVYLQRFNWASGDDSRMMQFAINGSADVGTLTYNGTDFAIAQSSDYRLKENIVDYTGGLLKIKALKVRSFNKKEGVSKHITQQGFIAHELAEHIPNAVIGTKDATKVDEAGETVPDYQQVTRESLVPYLVSAIQEQQTLIETLQTKVKALEEA